MTATDPKPKLMTRLQAPDTAGLAAAVDVLAAGGCVAFPTETVYGLGADATSGTAVAGIYAAKGRPSFNPLIAHVPDLEAALREGLFSPEALALAKAFWPGPLTLVVPVAETGTVCDLARAGLPSLGLRVPGHPTALALLRGFGRPVAAPSANRSGRISPTSAAHVMADLGGHIAMVLDGGPAHVGVESTIIACLPDAPPALLRPGGIARSDVETVLGHGLADAPRLSPTDAPLAPGLLTSHYAPVAHVRLNATHVQDGEVGLDFGGQLAAHALGHPILDLSPGGDLIEAAAHLFGALRLLDKMGAGHIAVAAIPDHGLGEAINDRLARAAAPR